MQIKQGFVTLLKIHIFYILVLLLRSSSQLPLISKYFYVSSFKIMWKFKIFSQGIYGEISVKMESWSTL